MRVLITGASGLIGSALKRSFEKKGHEMLLVTRSAPRRPEQIKWDVENGFASEDLERIEGIDAVVHLAGENVSGIRWTEEKKASIRESRVKGTKTIVDALFEIESRPSVFISMSGVDFYGDTGDDAKAETDKAGETFLAEVTKAWEAEARRAEDAGIRTVLFRAGMVLSKDGGALSAMLTPFKFGVGGVVGSGKQWMSWIALDDMIAAINFAIENDNIRGAVNAVSPNPVTNEEFTKTLGEVVYRPTFIPLPEFAVNLALGEMGHTLLLDSRRVVPKRLLDAGFEFEFPNLKLALEYAIQ